MAEVFGNLAGAIVISRISQHGYFILMSFIILIPSGLFLLLRDPKSLEKSSELKPSPISDIFKLLFSKKMMFLNLQLL